MASGCLMVKACLQVWVKIVDVRVEYGMLKISCSMKVNINGKLMPLSASNSLQLSYLPLNKVTARRQYDFHLPAQAVSQVDGKDLDPDNTVGKKFQSLKEEPPNVGTTHKAIVQSVKSYGAFVRLEGYKSNGLVHSSQVGCSLMLLAGSR